jgi:hypothetical protein
LKKNQNNEKRLKKKEKKKPRNAGMMGVVCLGLKKSCSAWTQATWAQDC